MTVATAELDALVRREHSNPHSVLGAHPQNGGVVVRALRPAASSVTAAAPTASPPSSSSRSTPAAYSRARSRTPSCRSATSSRSTTATPASSRSTIRTAFLPTIGELDQYLIAEGRHEELYDKLGAHVREMETRPPDPPVTGTAFAVWAPAARAVSVVGDFNSWDGRLHAMRSLGSTGIWELFLPGVGPGARYKYEILGADGQLLLKADPYALETEVPPKTASVVFEPEHEWSRRRRRVAARAPPDATAARATGLDLRGPSRLLAAELARGQPLADVPRARRRAVRVCQGHGLHPRRAAAGDGAPVQGLVGLPGHRLLRARRRSTARPTTSASSSTACTSTTSA